MQGRYRTILGWLTLVLLSLSLAACRIAFWGRDDDGGDDSFFFVVFGGEGDPAVPRVDPAVDEGRFVLLWSIGDRRETLIRFFLSHDPVLSPGGDPLIGESLCGDAIRTCTGELRDECRFAMDMTLFCGVSRPTDVSGFFPSLPLRAYIIARACPTAGGGACLEQARPVEFR